MWILLAFSLTAADLKPATIAAFERYERLTEARIATELRDPERFIPVDGLRNERVRVERLETRDSGREIDIPNGIVHHWAGSVFIPGARLEQVVALLQDYDHHADIYAPSVARSKLRQRSGDEFRFFLRLFMSKGIAVTMNTEHVAEFGRLGPDRAYSRIRSSSISEVEGAGSGNEREKPIGHDGGYLWRLNSYWRFWERDGGTYVRCESITLTRGIPYGFAWLIGPFITSIPRESLTFTLERTREAVVRFRDTP